MQPKGESKYIVRQCRDAELHEWAAMVGCSFIHRSGDPARFWHKYLVDPSSRAADIIVAEHAYSEALVAGVRVFDRTVMLCDQETHNDPLVMPVGGIGEVSTVVEHRRQGLGGRCMEESIQHMARKGFGLSSLSAAPKAAGLYRRCGYVPFPILYTTIGLSSTGQVQDIGGIPWSAKPGRSEPKQPTVHLSKHSMGDWWSELDACFQATARSLRLCGPMGRSQEHWRRFVPFRLTDGVAVTTELIQGAEEGAAAGGSTRPVQSYAGVVVKRGKVLVAEYCSQEPAGAWSPTRFVSAVEAAVASSPPVLAALERAGAGVTRARLPLVVARALAGHADLKPDADYTDPSWMYRLVQDADAAWTMPPRGAPVAAATPAAGSGSDGGPANAVQLVSRAAERGRHLVWYADGF